ncbi:hypothetical protein BD779DRAFT_1572405 [Infundibulicybe gibba]|nr:hypothetical protein BD779DRAFT_1572405 [Infundibulicybe gibba]
MLPSLTLSLQPLFSGITDNVQPPKPKTRPRRRPPLYSAAHPHFYVLAFPTTYFFLQQWGIDHGFTGSEAETTAAWRTISSRLWDLGPRCQQGVIYVEGIESLCIVVASNRTAADMARADDQELIQTVKTVLGTKEKPVWRKPIQI